MELRSAALTVAGLAALVHLSIFVYALRLIIHHIRQAPCTPYGQFFGYLIVASQTSLLLGVICAYHGLRSQTLSPWRALLKASATGCIAPACGMLFPGLDLLVNRHRKKRVDIFVFFAVCGVLIGLAAPFLVGIIPHHR